jgi:hypothetical protein
MRTASCYQSVGVSKPFSFQDEIVATNPGIDEVPTAEETIMTTTDKLVTATARHNEIVKRLGNGSLDPEAVLDAYQRIIEGQFDNPGLIHEMFTSPEAQLANVRSWNLERGWDFIEAHFVQAAAELEALTWPSDRLTVPVLVPYLDTVQRTFEELWAVASAAQPNNWRWDELKSDAEHLRLLEGTRHVPGLRWEVIDLGANWDPREGIRPVDVRAANSAHAGVLAAAGHFPKWVQAMDGTKVPYVWMPGYQVTLLGDEAWRYVPCLDWHQRDRKVSLLARWDGDCYRRWVCPLVRE